MCNWDLFKRCTVSVLESHSKGAELHSAQKVIRERSCAQVIQGSTKSFITQKEVILWGTNLCNVQSCHSLKIYNELRSWFGRSEMICYRSLFFKYGGYLACLPNLQHAFKAIRVLVSHAMRKFCWCSCLYPIWNVSNRFQGFELLASVEAVTMALAAGWMYTVVE